MRGIRSIAPLGPTETCAVTSQSISTATAAELVCHRSNDDHHCLPRGLGATNLRRPNQSNPTATKNPRTMLQVRYSSTSTHQFGVSSSREFSVAITMESIAAKQQRSAVKPDLIKRQPRSSRATQRLSANRRSRWSIRLSKQQPHSGHLYCASCAEVRCAQDGQGCRSKGVSPMISETLRRTLPSRCQPR